jgi:hypothetical protein
MSFLLQDSGAAIWLVDVTDQGLLKATASSGTPVVVNLSDVNGNAWGVQVTTQGYLEAVSVAGSAFTYPISKPMQSSGGFQFNLKIFLDQNNVGNLGTVLVPSQLVPTQSMDCVVWY